MISVNSMNVTCYEMQVHYNTDTKLITHEHVHYRGDCSAQSSLKGFSNTESNYWLIMLIYQSTQALAELSNTKITN